MKYFTKEWYELCQKTSFHLGLEEEKHAETFSEPYFQQLYNTELNSWLHLQEEISSIIENDEAAFINNNHGYEPFNRAKSIEQFHESFNYNQEHLQRNLPAAILKQIADIRVFTLNKATRAVINAVTTYCEDNERSVKATIEDYRRYMREVSNTMDKEIINKFRFHDCTITNTVQEDKSFVIRLDNSGGFTNINQVTFKNFNIIKQEGSLEDSWWLYEEVYKVNNRYEFHVLLQNNKMGLVNFIISADQVSF
ncbi:DUF4085 family protein [Paenibacillus sp. GCM10023248]|uniref:DUF4085 family protein n=1 Tax=unclassified Paenibacillus TaxID=185978 RepID=UPI0023797E57|nr:DUF4085 family protein [Paenibacillus sp. MAHUQ-63]MDD9271774.1 DUF4085 family protein [Paenibacillus sp. MAHUQ-63]